MTQSILTFTMMADGQQHLVDADLLCDMVSDCGFEELDIIDWEFDLYGREKLLSALKKRNLHCGCLITGISFYTCPEQVESAIKKGLILATEAGAEYLMIVPGGVDEEEIAICEKMSREEILDITVAGFQLACELAVPYGIKVVLETTPHAHKPLADTGSLLELLERVPEMGFVFDTANFRVSDTNADEVGAYEKMRHRIVRFHLKDVKIGDFLDGERCINGQSIKAVPLGTGVIAVDEIVKRSLSDGFDGCYVVEYAASGETHGLAHRDDILSYRQWLNKIVETKDGN